MRSYLTITLLLGITICIGCLLSIGLYWVQFYLLYGVEGAKQFHFLRIVSRTLTVVLFFVMIVYVKRIQQKSLSSYGLAKDEFRFRLLSGGFLLGTVSMSLLILTQVFLADSSLHNSPLQNKFFFDIVFQLLVSFTVATVEEWFFRGFTLQTLSQDMNIRSAVILSSLFFAATHFIRPVSHFYYLIPEFIGLFLIGVILANAYVYTKSIYLSIGIHAGWVYIVKLDKHFVNHFDSVFQKAFGGEKLLKSMVAWLFVLIILLLLRRYSDFLQRKNVSFLPAELEHKSN